MSSLHPIVWIDLETGGTDPRAHQITQIAALATDGTPDFNEIGKPFERKVCLTPGRYTDEALAKQHYGKETWAKEAVEIRVALQDLIDWTKPHTHTCISSGTGKTYNAAYVAGFNVSFDCDFLRASAERSKVWLPLMTWTGGYFDVLQLLRWSTLLDVKEPERFSLEHASKHLGLPDYRAHDAYSDVRQTVEMARALILGF